MSCVIEKSAKLDMSKICLKENGQKVDIVKVYLIENGQKQLLWSGELNMFYTVSTQNGGKVAFSADGITWEVQNATLDGAEMTNYGFRGLGYGNGVFVAAVRYSSSKIILAYSTDGINYYSAGISYSYSATYRIHFCFGNGTFLASCIGLGKTYYSKDGKVWTQCRDDAFEYKFLNGQFVRSDGTLAANRYYSTDGITWEYKESTTDSTYVVKDMTYFNGVYITGGYENLANNVYGYLCYTYDLENWTTVKKTTSYAMPYSVETNGEIAALVGADYSYTENNHKDGWIVNSDLTTEQCSGLTSGTLGDSDAGTHPFAHMVYHDGIWVCAITNIYGLKTGDYIYNTFAYSHDGKTWTEYEVTSMYCAGIVYAG